AVHTVEHAVSHAVQIALNAQRGKFIGNDPEVPAGRVGLMLIARAVSQDLRRGFALVPGTEWTKAFVFDNDALPGKVAGTPGAIRGDDHQRPVTGSLRSSGTVHILPHPLKPRSKARGPYSNENLIPKRRLSHSLLGLGFFVAI